MAYGATTVRYVSGDWSAALGQIRLRVESDQSVQPQDLLFSPADIQPLIVLLLVLSGKAAGSRSLNRHWTFATSCRYGPIF